MATKTKGISEKLLAELQDALSDPRRPPDPASMAKACREMARMRKQLRKKLGDLDVAVDLIREARNL
ncbi:MAG: hypothetical protein L0215_01325 [Gemmataceae bacterium]|nr:hypothetical protein [Gemmataceae bacterium]